MPVVIISSDTPERECLTAKDVAAHLGYKLLGRELLVDVAKSQGIAEEKLVEALDQTPAFFTMSSRRRKELLTHIQASCLDRLREDQTVCYGLSANLFITGVSHAVRVRILTDPKERVAGFVRGKGAAEEKAYSIMRKMDLARSRWSMESYGTDERSPELYDIVLNLANMEFEKAVEIICNTAGYRKFQAMTYSRRRLWDMALASRVRELLLHQFPKTRVEVSDGTVMVQVQSMGRNHHKRQQAVRDLACQVPGVRNVEVHVIKDYFGHAAISDR